MSATSIPVARILQLGVPIAWQEAVELARSAHSVAESAGVPLLLDECVISTEGTVHLVPAPAGRPGPPLTVTGLLGILLEGQDAPAQLRALVDGDRDDSASEQRLDLSWFSSPRPDLEIARLAARGIEAAAAHEAQAVIHRLRTDVTDTPSSPKPAAAPSRFNPRALLRPLGIAAAVLMLLAAGLVVRTAMTPAPAPAPAVAGDAEPTASKSFLDTAFDALKRALAPSGDATSAPAADAAAAGAANSRPRAGRGTSSAPANTSGAPAPPASAAGAVPGGVPSRDGFGEVPTTMDEVVVTATMPRVYSQQDAGVEPPAFIYPQMPSEPKQDSPPSDSRIEVVVDEQGRVVQVRLRSSDATLNDRMIVSAAKAWQFRPALKDGQPVPYVLQVPVIR